MDASNVWGNGHPKESTKDQVFDLLKSNPDQMYTPIDVRHLLSDREPLDFDGNLDRSTILNFSLIMSESATMGVALERLVDEGEVDKRSFEVDQVNQILENIPDAVDMASDVEASLKGSRLVEKHYYRIASQHR